MALLTISHSSGLSSDVLLQIFVLFDQSRMVHVVIVVEAKDEGVVGNALWGRRKALGEGFDGVLDLALEIAIGVLNGDFKTNGGTRRDLSCLVTPTPIQIA